MVRALLVIDQCGWVWDHWGKPIPLFLFIPPGWGPLRPGMTPIHPSLVMIPLLRSRCELTNFWYFLMDTLLIPHLSHLHTSSSLMASSSTCSPKSQTSSFYLSIKQFISCDLELLSLLFQKCLKHLPSSSCLLPLSGSGSSQLSLVSPALVSPLQFHHIAAKITLLKFRTNHVISSQKLLMTA